MSAVIQKSIGLFRDAAAVSMKKVTTASCLLTSRHLFCCAGSLEISNRASLSPGKLDPA